MSDHDNTKNYARRLARILTRRYCDLVARMDPAAYEVLQKRLDLQKTGIRGKKRAAKLARIKAYIRYWKSLDAEQQLTLAAHDAKINHLGRLARTIGTTEIVHAHNRIKTTTAGSIDYVIRQFRAQDVAPEQVQKFLDENAVAWFSLTGHPTNPTTVDYTRAQTRLAYVITNPETTPADLEKALLDIYHTPIIGDRKSPLEEAEETLNTLHVIYDTALAHRDLFNKALADYGYAENNVRVTTPLIVPCAWTLGDGDGNESLTPRVLEDGIRLHRRSIAGRYLETLQQIQDFAAFDPEIAGALQILRGYLEEMREARPASFADPSSLALYIENIASNIDIYQDRERSAVLKERIIDLAYLVSCFGFGFGMIDIRHNAVDILKTVKELARIAGIGTAQDLDSCDLDHLHLELTAWLKDDKALELCRAVNAAQFDDTTAGMIWGRLQVIGRNPDLCEKLIIAETTHPAHALAALLLLKATGNIVGEEGSRIDLTLLSESVRDLTNLGNTLETLLENESFRFHVASRGRLLVMIAKSDTTRQDGRGEAEYAQYEAAVDIYRVGEKMGRKYPELENVLTSIMNGGGHALQRGGGRVTEVPAVHGRAAAEARVFDCGPSTLTIQGHQMTILFCPGKVALGTLEALASQNLYTKAGVHGEMPDVQAGRNMNRQYARADAWLYARVSGLAFDALTRDNPAIDNLLRRAPWLAMKAGNASSRPPKRGEKQVGPGITPREAAGDNPRALQGRAISGERLTAHACLPVFTVLGLLEAMETVRGQGLASRNPEKYGDALHHLYRTHKIHRDGARATINAVTMADFDIAWPLLAGRPRPSAKDVSALALRFDYKDMDERDSPAITLAFLEDYFLRTEKLSYEMVSGQKARLNFRHGDALKILWPELENEVANRSRAAEFSRVIECYRAMEFQKYPDRPLSEIEFRITQSLYASADVINAPVGILATRTRLEPVTEMRDGVRTKFMKPESYLESDVAGLLAIPPSLA